jgi:hypothetical protein
MRHIVNLQPEMDQAGHQPDAEYRYRPQPAVAGEGTDHLCAGYWKHHQREGVETAGELEMLRSLGVEKAQGFYLGKLMSLEDALRVGPLDVQLAISA